MVFLALMLGTLVPEDLACIAAGLLIREGRIAFASGTAACAGGILAGDAGLWVIGRASRRAFGRWPVVSRRMQRLPLDDMRRWLEEHAAGAMIASRFIPGTRLPLYICAGLVGMPLGSFTAWASIAVLLWTPALVWLSAGAGGAAPGVLPSSRVAGWRSRIAFVAVLFVLLRAARPLVSSHRSLVRLRAKRYGETLTKLGERSLSAGGSVSARLARWSRWEFWPMWLFYAPVAIWVFL